MHGRIKMIFCSKCVLPETFPGLQYNESGICNYCLHTPLPDDDKKNEYLSEFENLLDRTKGKQEYDAIIAYSGGKDSTHTMNILTKKYGLKVLAWTLDNGFLSEDYPQDSKLRKFQSTNKFKRSGDVMLRVSRQVELNDKLIFTPSILPIYHISNDKYTSPIGLESEIEGSNGLTLNGNIYFDYNLSSTNAVQLNFGAPLVVRDIRPDGLTRSFIVNFEYSVKF